MAAKYDVRIVSYKTAKGNQVSITFKNEALHNLTLTCVAYFKIWGKASRLYFLTASPTTGVKLTEGKGALLIAKADVVEALKKYEGEYTQLRYDDVSHYYYVDLEDRYDAVVNAGLMSGISKNLKGQSGHKTVKENIYSEEEDKKVVVDAKAEEKPNTTAKHGDSAVELLTQALIECVISQKNEAAMELALLIKKLS